MGLVAAGVVKALADVVHVAGCDGGTGASPLSSIKNAGVPWELGLAETQQTLVAEGSARPGASPRGRRAEDRPRRRRGGAARRRRGFVRDGAPARRGLPDGPVVPSRHVPGGDRHAAARAARQVRGDAGARRGLPRPPGRGRPATPCAARFAELRRGGRTRRVPAAPRSGRRPRGRRRSGAALAPRRLGPAGYTGETRPTAPGGELGAWIAGAALRALEGPSLVELDVPISNSDRTVGAQLGGAIAGLFGAGKPPGRVRVTMTGSAGQSFGAFLSAGVRLDLTGEANDGVGKGMGGGRIVIRPPEGDAGEPTLLGNAALYGATGGELFCAGRAGERFAVRNSGADRRRRRRRRARLRVHDRAARWSSSASSGATWPRA